jgi:hypothetical protein
MGTITAETPNIKANIMTNGDCLLYFLITLLNMMIPVVVPSIPQNPSHNAYLIFIIL